MYFNTAIFKIQSTSYNKLTQIGNSPIRRDKMAPLPSGLENRGLDASIYHKTRKPTEGTKSLSVQRTEDRRTSLRSF
ncbi:hypothetical protein B1H38_12480 [Leptospira borgpetersenii serovar Ballum]|nr:hypothetical protein B1H38_12480 [Leptospira borgpetersenii serovar Ballum]